MDNVTDPVTGGEAFAQGFSVATAALRITSGQVEFAGPLAQALLIAGVVFLLTLLALVVFWRAGRTGRRHHK